MVVGGPILWERFSGVLGWCLAPLPLRLPSLLRVGDARSPRCGSARADPSGAVLSVSMGKLRCLQICKPVTRGLGGRGMQPCRLWLWG